MDLNGDRIDEAAPLIEQRRHLGPVHAKHAAHRRRWGLFGLYFSIALQSFSGAGLLAILDLYMSNYLNIGSNTSNAITNAYVVVNSAVAPLGGWLGDKKIGNYRTQFWCQVLWVIGQALLMLMTVSAFNSILGGVDSVAVRLLVTTGFLIQGIGSGIINPIQSVFIADQFDDEGEENEKARVSSFSWFYFWCNVGNFGGESINPELRATAGPVYAMMSITGSLFIGFASFVACKRFYIQKPLDRSESAKEDPDATRIAQLPWRRRAQLWWLSDNGRAVWKLIKVFALLIPFWAVLNQQNSSWDDQGSNMNGQLCFTASKCVTIAPDTM